jgi:hypothetical protein
MAVKAYDEFEVYRARALKVYRAAIRLKYSLLADEEIARRLPEVQTALDTALNSGEPSALDPGQIFEDTL